MIKDFINIINLDNYIKNETILIKREISIKLPDAIILAAAKINNLILLTQDEGILKYNVYKNIQMKKCF
ncbi:PIN domain-containing protein [Brachyspira hampsonii]|uniref:PIN domain-containing protein n=1 Tax=Brachyspira hampsonii TaxID=1287055 RepID=UPI00280C2908|nr:PIN domain-containing protein [Brachyspira hampsonii]